MSYGVSLQCWVFLFVFGFFSNHFDLIIFKDLHADQNVLSLPNQYFQFCN